MSSGVPPTTHGAQESATLASALYGLATTLVRRAPRDLSLTSAATLATLYRTGPRRITDLAVVEGIAQPSMTTVVTGLVNAGMAQRRPDPTDKRAALVSITPEGRDYLRARRHAGAASLARLIEQLSGPDIAALTAAVPALTRLVDLDAAERDPAGTQA